MRSSNKYLTANGLLIAALGLSVVALPAPEAQAGELYSVHDPNFNVYTPNYGYTPEMRRARPSTVAQRRTTPRLRSSSGYAALRANKFESRVLANIKAEEKYELKLAAFQTKKAKAEIQRREKAEKERIALERKRLQQARSRESAMRREQGRRGVLFETLDKNKPATITQASNKTGAEAELTPAKKGPKDQSVWSRIKYIFMGA